ncbi:NAD-dependent succinate-semialdehyde dehydrogenase [Marinobacterium marinum]|uniref:NAD-dependent succinate-semialdehyde dehydrogenase n=1 Tax=Marinobacterium marinum TaxID=2756129 RepID=A0A7W1WY92_9GAMM|nr:NAD-dependent succinate-semialdehyde dehydrogenase [Marinobacterium marinum]MBA4502426.1 NAD-dependent succinate-semialdehyde dehydrogenase [Marinobacterium marinum]
MLKVINPTSGQTLHSYPALDATAMGAIIRSSHTAFGSWCQTSFKERADVLNRVAILMREQETRLAQLMTLEMGKPVREARGEVRKAAWCAEHYAAHAADYLTPLTLQSDARRSYVQYLPLGPVLGILPWNAPFWLAFRFCAPALMAGNTCLMKHDPHVPACAEAIADLFEQAGAPAGILHNLPLATASIESAIRHPLVRAISFTGSSAAGSRVAALAAAAIKPAVLELGGSDPAIVLKDADLELAADTIALSRVINAGQSCIAAKRIIVEAPIHDHFVELLKTRLAAFKSGDPADPTTDIGPLAREDLRTVLARQVDETIAAGARCLLGGYIPEGTGFFYPVTLLTNVRNDMTACREETFGPVAVVLQADNAEQAVQIANDTEYGLAASIWTEHSRGESLARDIEAGQVVINGLVKTDPRLPSGGIKRSGYGRELGPQGIMEFVNLQQVWVGPGRD